MAEGQNVAAKEKGQKVVVAEGPKVAVAERQKVAANEEGQKVAVAEE